jgi:hypothetical protein
MRVSEVPTGAGAVIHLQRVSQVSGFGLANVQSLLICAFGLQREHNIGALVFDMGDMACAAGRIAQHFGVIQLHAVDTHSHPARWRVQQVMTAHEAGYKLSRWLIEDVPW